jgi:polysaccharide chain length determinant protein (PEP-CTERM system associated)
METAVSQSLTVLRGVWHRRWIGLVTAWIVGLGAGVAIFLIPDRYEASARIYLDTQTILRPLMSGLAVQPNVNEQVSMLSRTLISRPNVERLIRMTDMDLQLKSQKEREELVDKLMKTLKIKGAGGENLYVLSFQHTDPQEAKKVVQSLVSIFVESSLGSKRKDTDQARRFIEEQIASYEQKLVEAENRLKEFRLKHMSMSQGPDKDYFSRYAQLAQQLEAARLELRSAENSREALKRELSGEEPVFLAEDSPTMQGSEVSIPELDSRIASLKAKLDELLRVYTDEHPDVVGTRRVLAQLEEQRKQEVAARKPSEPGRPGMAAKERNPVYQQLRVSLAETEARIAALRAQVGEYERKTQQMLATARMVPEVEAEFAQLNRDYDVQKRNYDTLIARRESAAIAERMEESGGSVDFRVVDPPRVSPKPVAPNRLMLMPVGLLAALAAGFAVSVLVSQLFPVFFDIRSLRTALDRPVLGSVSMLATDALRRARRRGHMLFAGGVGGLVAAYGGVIALLLMLSYKG